MTPYIFLSLLGSLVVLGTAVAIAGFQMLKIIAKNRATNTRDQAQVSRLRNAIERMVVTQKAIFVLGVIFLGVLLFIRTVST